MRRRITKAGLWDLLRRAQGVSRLERGLAAHASELRTALAGSRDGLETLRRIQARLDQAGTTLERLDSFITNDLRLILRAIAAEDAENRRRLWHARCSPSYDRPFTEPNPLVSVVIPTFDRISLLCERSLPSVLGQTHDHLEVIVVGDHAAEELADAVAGLADRRVRFHNLTQRLPPSSDPQRQWFAGSSVIARNEGFRLARGLWLKSFDDDDFLRPNAVADLLEAAREFRAEVVYGRLLSVRDNIELGEFPPREGAFGFQASIVHRDLSFFERELVAGAFAQPNDAFSMEAMLRAGVRFHMIPSTVCDYHPAGPLR